MGGWSLSMLTRRIVGRKRWVIDRSKEGGAKHENDASDAKERDSEASVIDDFWGKNSESGTSDAKKMRG